MDEKNAPLMEHLKELRKVIVWIVVAWAIGVVVCYSFFINEAMALITAPIDDLNLQLMFIGVPEGLMAHLKVALLGGAILASPVIFWQLISFIMPALYRHERIMFFILLFFGVLLFVAGIAFAYFLVLRPALYMLLFVFSGDLVPQITVEYYVNFVLRFLVPFGIVFEIPMFVYFLTKMGIITPKLLREKRKYVILIILVLAAVMTPPDVISQLMIGGPMLILYEFSIRLSSVVYKRKQKRDAKKRAAYDEEDTDQEDSTKD